MTFDEVYRKKGVEACRSLVEMQAQGLHDMTLRLREKEITHEAIVELADQLAILSQRVASIVKESEI